MLRSKRGKKNYEKSHEPLVLNPGHDFHWFRQVSDMEGAWCHKLGGNNATEKDNEGNVIFVPSAVTIGAYTVFLGYFALIELY